MKIAYLTIDDVPSKDFKRKVNYLISKGIPAVFFCRGNLMEKRCKEIIYAIKKGFIIGNHSYEHIHFSKISIKEAENQIRKTDEIIEKLYNDANLERPIKIFRFPYGDKGTKETKKKIQDILGNLGYKQPRWEGITYRWFKENNLNTDFDTYWTYDFEEWRLKGDYQGEIKTFDDILKKMEDPQPKEGGSLLNKNSAEILLMHDHEETTKFFFKIIDKLIKMKIKFKLPDLK